MKKTMYSAMKNLAEYIAASQSSDFDGIWDEWSSKYKPEDYMELPLLSGTLFISALSI